ncbi:MAG: MFS transporter [Chloroflexi bacterium]|nr:MFS transporter [Chloroflexota bacterium]
MTGSFDAAATVGPPTKRLSTRHMILYGVANAGTPMVNALANAALPLYLASYGVPNTVIGFLAQERSFVGGVIHPFIGAVSDRTRTRFGRRRPYFLLGVPLTAVCLLALAGHPPLWAVVTALAVLGMFLAVAQDPYLALMGDIAPEEQRGRIGGIMSAFSMVGQFTIIGASALFWATREPLVFAVAIAGYILAFSVTFLTIKEPELDGQAPPPFGKISVRQYFAGVLEYRELSRYMGALFFYWLASGASVPFVTRFMTQELHATTTEAFSVVLIVLVATFFLAAPAGLAGDRYGRRRILAVGLALFALIMLVGSQVQTIPQAAMVMAAFGLANAAVISMMYPCLNDLMPEQRRGEFTGIGSTVWSLAQPLGAVAGGLAIDVTGSYRSVFLVCSLMYFVSFLALRTVGRTAPVRVPSP